MTKRSWSALALVVALAGGMLLMGAPSSSAARSRPKSHASKRSAAAKRAVVSKSGRSAKTAEVPRTQADFAAGRILLDTQDRYNEARALYSKQQHDAAIAELDDILPVLNRALETTPDKRIRGALGTLLSRSGSLRLAAAKARDAAAKTSGLTYGQTASANPAETRTFSPDSAIAVEPAPASEIPLPDAADFDAADESTFDLPAVDDDPNAIEIEAHPRVAIWLDYFTGRGRGTFERWLERSGLYMGWMKRVLEREGVPSDLVHLVFVESGFNPHARSYASAVGPWQFIRGTAKMFGLTVNSWVDERKDPEASTVAAARYLKHLNGLFNSWPLALASYNAGEQTVIDAIKRQGTRDFWSLRLPQQTKDYVPKFMAVLAIARDPKRYGFDDVSILAPMSYDEVNLPAPVDLRALASACDVEVAEIQRLNPAILKYAAPGKGEDITLRVPEGSGDKLRESLENGSLELPKIETPPDPVVLRHKVRRGESLKALSLRYGVPPNTIARYNRIGKKSRLRVGRTLLIPMKDQATEHSSAARPGPAAPRLKVPSEG